LRPLATSASRALVRASSCSFFKSASWASASAIFASKAQGQGWQVIYFSGKRSFSPMSALSWAATKPSRSPSLPVWVSVWFQAIACMDFKKSTGSALWMSLAFPCPQPGTLFTLEAKKCRRWRWRSDSIYALRAASMTALSLGLLKANEGLNDRRAAKRAGSNSGP